MCLLYVSYLVCLGFVSSFSCLCSPSVCVPLISVGVFLSSLVSWFASLIVGVPSFLCWWLSLCWVVRVFPCICVPLAVSFMCVGDWVCPSLFVVLLSVYFSCACLTVCVGVSCMFLYVVGLYLW